MKGMTMLPLTFIFLHFFCGTFNAKTVVVTCYDESNNCLQEAKSLQTCLLSDNNVCYINNGRYGMNISITNLNGNKSDPFIIAGKSGINSDTIIDGTVEINSILSNSNNKWEIYDSPNNKTCIYRIKLSQLIWQLFVENDMMTPARWPNALWKDKSVFNWSIAQAISSKNSTIGMMVDNGVKNFKHEISFNLTNNATAILNIGSWITVSSLITKHIVNTTYFNYYVQPEWIDRLHFQPQFGRYYLENNINFLDEESEWFIDRNSKYLYLSPNNCVNPNTFQTTSVRGKINTYSINIRGSSYISFENLTLFSTAFNIINSNDITFKNMIFNYSTYSKRAIGESNKAAQSSIFHYGDNLSIINSWFYGGDGDIIDYIGNNGYFYNNLFEYTSYSCIGWNNNGTSGGSGSIESSRGKYDTFIQNTVRNYGPSVGYGPPQRSNVTMNEIYGGSSLQDDGSCIQIGENNINGSIYYKNWAYNTGKRAYRFDRGNQADATMGFNGTMSHLIGFNTGGVSIKGNNHLIINNVIFNTTGKWNPLVPPPSYQPDIMILSYDPTCNYCIVGENNMTITQNNGAVNFSGQSNKPYPISGTFINDINGDVIDQLINPNNFDFRPKNGSIYAKNNIGPYLINDTFYWIPGQQVKKSSFPIISKQYKENKIDLIWRPGYKAKYHKIKIWRKNDKKQIINKYIPYQQNIWTLYGINKINISNLLWKIDAIDCYGNVNLGDSWSLS